MLPFVAAMKDDKDGSFITGLFLKHRVAMYKRARRFSVSDADDIVNETCLELFKKVDLLRTFSDERLKSHVIATVKYIGLAHLRKNGKYVTGTFDFDSLPNNEPELDSDLLNQCRIDDLINAIKELSLADQVMLEMKYFLDMSDVEIAIKQGIQESSVRSELSRARKRLRSILITDDSNE